MTASAYLGPPPLTWTQALTAWVFHPVPVALVVLLGSWYAWRVRTMRRSGRSWPRSRTVWFFCGLAAYLVATCSFIGAYHQVLFSMRALQVVILLMVIPQLWAHGLPGTLARDTATPTGRRVASGVLHARPTQVLTHPIAGLLILLGLPIGLYGSGWYSASLTSHLGDELTQLALLTGGLHYFWTRLQRDPVPKLFPQYVTTWLTFADVILDALVPAAIMISPVLVATGYYATIGRTWGPSLAADEYTGASFLWVLGDFAGLPFLLLSLRQLRRRDEADAAAIDAELDELQAAEAQQHRDAEGNAAGIAGPPGLMRPWWENDPDLAEHLHWKQR